MESGKWGGKDEVKSKKINLKIERIWTWGGENVRKQIKENLVLGLGL